MTRSDAPERVTLRRVRLPLVVPLRSAHGVEAVRDLVVVEVVAADGTSGWGECSALSRPTYTAEHVAGACPCELRSAAAHKRGPATTRHDRDRALEQAHQVWA